MKQDYWYQFVNDEGRKHVTQCDDVAAGWERLGASPTIVTWDK